MGAVFSLFCPPNKHTTLLEHGRPMEWSQKESFTLVFYEYEKIHETATRKTTIVSKPFCCRGEKFQFELKPKGSPDTKRAWFRLARVDVSSEESDALCVDQSLSLKCFKGGGPVYYPAKATSPEKCWHRMLTSNNFLRRFGILDRDGALRIKVSIRIRVPIEEKKEPKCL